jgi:subtilisin family serine protease
VTAAVESPVPPNRIESDVHDALTAGDDGYVYVVIVLADAVGPQNADPVARADTARTQQQVVLDTLDATEFDLVHRPDDVAGLTGRINASGLDKLAELDVVARVGIDVMQSGCAGQTPDQCDEDLKDASLFALTKLIVLPPPSPPTPSAEVDDGTPPAHYYYHKLKVDLTLDKTRLAVTFAADLSGADRLAAAAGAGVVVTDAAATGLHRRDLLTLETALANKADAHTKVDALLQSPQIDFVTPVFVGRNDGWMAITPDVLVRFHPAHRAGAADTLAVDAPDLQTITPNFGDMDGAYRLRSDARNGFDVLRAANRLARDPRIAWAEPDFLFTGRGTLNPNDQYYFGQWAMRDDVYDVDLDGHLAWDTTTGDSSIKVLILETGIQMDHPDMLGKIVDGKDFTSESPGTNGGPVNNCDNHGTTVAGCIVAEINNSIGVVGIAPGCRVLSARPFITLTTFCDGRWTHQPSWTVEALAWGQAQGARISNNSNAYGVNDQCSCIEDKYAETYAAGMIHFAAAGNTGDPILEYPASVPFVNSVSSTWRDGILSGFSSHGVGLDFSAPGDEIWTTDRTAPDGFVPTADYALGVSGTSYASPHAAGVAALILSQAQAFAPVEVEAIMRQTTRDLGPVGYDTEYGWGLVNANNPLVMPVLVWGCDVGVSPDPTSFIFPQSHLASIDEFDIRFNDPITITGTITICSTGGAPPTSVTLTPVGTDGTYTVTLDTPLEKKHWTTILIPVERTSSVITDTIALHVAHLPADVNQDGSVGLADSSAFVNEFNGQARPCLVDSNHDNQVGLADVSDWVNNFNGNASIGIPPANGTFLPAKPACP